MDEYLPDDEHLLDQHLDLDIISDLIMDESLLSSLMVSYDTDGSVPCEVPFDVMGGHSNSMDILKSGFEESNPFVVGDESIMNISQFKQEQTASPPPVTIDSSHPQMVNPGNTSAWISSATPPPTEQMINLTTTTVQKTHGKQRGRPKADLLQSQQQMPQQQKKVAPKKLISYQTEPTRILPQQLQPIQPQQQQPPQSMSIQYTSLSKYPVVGKVLLQGGNPTVVYTPVDSSSATSQVAALLTNGTPVTAASTGIMTFDATSVVTTATTTAPMNISPAVQQNKNLKATLISNEKVSSNNNNNTSHSNAKVPIARWTEFKPKAGKRSAHNAIEKKYRRSINDRIDDLKQMLVGDKGKMNKSAVLRKAVERIMDLQKENEQLRRLLLQNGVQVHRGSTSLRMLLEEPKLENMHMPFTPPRSDESDPSYSPRSSTGSNDSSDKDSDSEGPSSPKMRRGMTTNKRTMVCMFMFAVLAFNPFGSMWNRYEGRAGGDALEMGDGMGAIRRNILGSEDEDSNWAVWQTVGTRFMIWLANMLVVWFCLIRMLVYGDPVMAAGSKEAGEYSKRKVIAERAFKTGNYSAALNEYHSCLELFGQPVPRSRFQCVLSTGWQFFRMGLHRLWIGRWLSRKTGGLFCSPQVRTEALASAREVAHLYHRLNQLHMVTKSEDAFGLLFSLCAVNMAEAAGSQMATQHLIEIYLTAALRVKETYPRWLQYFCRYYVAKARAENAQKNGGAQVPASLQWAFTPYGYKFFVTHPVTYGAERDETLNLFSRLENASDPLSFVMRTYREHLLKRALQALVGTGHTAKYDVQKDKKKDREVEQEESFSGTQIFDVLCYTQLMNETMGGGGADGGGVKTEVDRVAVWWSNLIMVSAYWMLGEDDKAIQFYAEVERMPGELAGGKDKLPLAILAAFRAKKMLLNKMNGDSEAVHLELDKGSDALEDSLTMNKFGPSYMKNIKLLGHLLACDWLLEARTTIWEQKHATEDSNCYAPVSGQVLSRFQADLNLLRIIAEGNANVQQRVYLYEAVNRLMAGASPGHTQQLLDRSLRHRSSKSSSLICGKDRNHQWESGERERAAALYVACKYLPSPLLSLPGERMGMLVEAAKSLEKIGDKKRLQDCYLLMKSLGSGTAVIN